MGGCVYPKSVSEFYFGESDLFPIRERYVSLWLCRFEQSVHLVVQQKDGKLSDWVRDFKKFTSKKLLKMIFENPLESRGKWMKMIFEYHAEFNKRSGDLQFWTHENHAIELYRPEIIESRMKYIHENPVRAGWVENAEEYLYSSARNYSGLKGLIEVDYW